MLELEKLSSFRDPSGTVFFLNGRVLRKVSADAACDTLEFLASGVAGSLSEQGKLVTSKEIPFEEVRTELSEHKLSLLEMFGPGGITLEHDRIWFPSYVYEWPAEMLYAAGLLTLDVAEAALAHGYGLKDATPYNVLFRGAEPVFVDILSFEKREPGDYIWLPYAQFVRMFLLPLLMQSHFGAGLD
ncbi:MAG: SAM-dependent methyltransferase, partial [Acidobacteriota bacterium]|nr:SAM-dependent methyltransferase [Acidobacteriota bacterium]